MSERLVLRVVTVDLSIRQVAREDGRFVSLTPRECDLLKFLASRRGAIVSRDELLTEVWGYAESVVSRTVDTTVRRLRAKIEADPDAPEHLITAHGLGYRLVTAPLAGAPLPSNADRLVGRGREVQEIEQILETSQAATLVGPPGVGKTRLAIEIGARASKRLPGSCLFADLSAISLQEGVLRGDRRVVSAASAVAGSLGLAVAESRGSIERRIEYALADRGRTLLILDNCEGAISQLEPAIARWCLAAPELRVLATSRQPIGYDGERLLPLGPLEHAAAIELFIELSSRHAPEARYQDEELIGSLVERLDRLPLAITLAASRASALSPRQLLARLDDRFRLLASHQRDVGERHQTLRAALDVSWEMLSIDECRVLAALSVFRGGFDIDAARVVTECSDIEAVLESLRRRSLVACNHALHPPRWESLASVWDYAHERLFEDPREASRAMSQHVVWFARLREKRRRVQLVVDVANLGAAIERAIALGRPKEAAQACLGLQDVVECVGPYELAREWTVRVLEIARDASHIEERIMLLLRLASIEDALGGDPFVPLDEACALALQIDDPQWRQLAARDRALALANIGRFDEARVIIDEMLPSARAYRTNAFRLLRLRATIARRAGELALARVLLAEAVENASIYGNEIDLRYMIGSLALLDQASGRFDEARAGLKRVRDSCLRDGWLPGAMTASRSLAAIAIDTGDAEEAHSTLSEARELARTLGDPQMEVSVRNGLALVARMGGNWQQALMLHREAVALAERISSRVWMVIERANIGEMLMFLGSISEAEPYLLTSIHTLAEMSYHEPLTAVRSALVELYTSQGRLDEAQSLIDTLEASAGGLHPETTAMLHVRRGLLQLARGEDAEGSLRAAITVARNRTETAIHIERLRVLVSRADCTR